MKKFKKAFAVLAIAAMVMSMAACKKNEATESDPTAVETNVAVEEIPTNEAFVSKYGNQLPYYMNHQYTFNGEPVPVAQSNFYIIKSFSDLSTYASFYGFPTTLDGHLDLSASYDNTGSTGEEFNTWGDFLVDYAEGQIKDNLIIRDLAEKKGLKLPDEKVAEVTDFFNSLETDTLPGTGLTMEEYLAQFFGDSCTKEEAIKVMCDQNLVEYYMQDYADHYVIDEADLQVPNIRYALFYAPEGTSQEELDSQKAAAEAFLNKCSDLDIFQIEGAISEANGSVYEFGDEIAVEKGVMVPEFEAWAWDDARKEGDMEVIKTEAYGYFVVGYLGMTSLPQSSIDSIATSALRDEVDAIEGSYDLHTDEEYTGVPVVTTPTPEYSSVTVIREDGTVQNPKDLKDYTNVIIISILGVAAAGVIGASIYGNISKKKQDKLNEAARIANSEKQASKKQNTNNKKKKNKKKKRK